MRAVDEPGAAASGGSYILRGGRDGRERLRLLARLVRPTTLGLLQQLGVGPGLRCLDVGCGGGDVTLDLARLVGPQGHVIGLDLDPVKLELAAGEAAAAGIGNVDFRCGDAYAPSLPGTFFDLVYARFLLTHLREPGATLVGLRGLVAPEGRLVIEDIDWRGQFIEPPSPAFERFVALYARTAEAHGCDPAIGPRLPGLLRAAGVVPEGMRVAHPAAFEGEAKLITPLTLEAIADAAIAKGLATAPEIEHLAAELFRLARDPTTVIGTVRIIQTWARCP